MARFNNKIIFILGWMLSPFTWWNDSLVNIPLAYFFANIAAHFAPRFFLPCLIIFYWLTNLLGIVLMQVSSQHFLKERPGKVKFVVMLLFYTLAIYILARQKIIRPIF